MFKDYRINQFGRLFSEGIEAEPGLTYQERLTKRRTAIAEDFSISVLRCVTDAVHLANPRRIASLPATLSALASPETALISGPPDARFIRPAGSGFVSAALDLSPAGILDGIGRGLIPRWIAGRPTWWAPAQRIAGDPRIASEPEAALTLLAEGGVRVTLDREFETVAAKCARRAILRGRAFQPNRAGLAAMARVYDAGFGHSVEICTSGGRLIGGCYGIATGRVFVTMARFGVTRAAADLSLVALNRHLAHWGYAYHDLCADWNGLAFGFAAQKRDEAQACLIGCLAGDRRGRWLAVPALVDGRNAANS